MKKLILILFLLLLSSESFFPQTPYKHYFSGLRGLEDKNGKTHLFYTLFEAFKNPDYYEDNTSVTIFHLNLADNSTSEFLQAGYKCGLPYCTGRSISDFEFWNNDPSKYIYAGNNGGMDPNPYFERYDGTETNAKGFWGILNIELSKQNDSVLFYSSAFELYKSNDYTADWSLASNDFLLVRLNPFNDNILFGQSKKGDLVKSFDGGKSSFTVDTVRFGYSDIYKFFYDKDSSYIYRIVDKRLFVSSKSGSPFSFEHKFTGRKDLLLTVDTKTSGRIYIADGKSILVSGDFGDSFKPYKDLDQNIIAIYAKPGTDIVYAATGRNIYEIQPGSVKTLKTLPVLPGILKYYPLAKGNKWFYSFADRPLGDPVYFSEMRREVMGDTLMPNGKKYFFIREIGPYPSKTYSRYYERIDSVTGKVYRYLYEIDKTEVVVDDLAASAGDTVYSSRFSGNYPLRFFLKTEDIVKQWDMQFPAKHFEYDGLPGPIYYDLLQGIGISSIVKWYDFGSASFDLKGCIIDCIVYGDTNLVSVDEKLPVANNFQLFQNYPNPFNPYTVIKYSLPYSCFVSLKVYDALGNQIAALVEEEQSKGFHEVSFPKQNSHMNLPSGIYFYSIKAAGQSETRKMLIVK